jgi:hypothetical protein
MSTLDEARAGGPQHEVAFHIIVNAREKTVTSSIVTFDQVVQLAFNPVPIGPNVLLTVTYRHAASTPDTGTLVQGQSVDVRNGTNFTVRATDKS